MKFSPEQGVSAVSDQAATLPKRTPRKPPLDRRLRKYHRWTSTAAAFVLVWVSVTGAALGIDVWTSGRAHPAQEPAVGPLPADLAPQWLAQAAAQTQGEARLVLNMTDQGARLRVTTGGNPGQARQETVIAPSQDKVLAKRTLAPEIRAPRWRSDLHRLLEDLHRGTIIGLPGQLLNLIAGFSFVFLAGSGIWIYFDMWRKRRRAGRPGFFWSR